MVTFMLGEAVVGRRISTVSVQYASARSAPRSAPRARGRYRVVGVEGKVRILLKRLDNFPAEQPERNIPPQRRSRAHIATTVPGMRTAQSRRMSDNTSTSSGRHVRIFKTLIHCSLRQRKHAPNIEQPQIRQSQTLQQQHHMLRHIFLAAIRIHDLCS